MNIPISLGDFGLKEKALLGIMGMALIWAAFDGLFYRPVAKELDSVRMTVTEKRNTENQEQIRSNKLAPIRESVQRELIDLKRPYLIETNQQIAEFNRVIDDALDRHNIQVKSMSPGNVQAIQGKEYQLLTYTQELNCDYNQLGHYMSDLENAELLIEVTNLEITPLSDELGRHKVRLELNAYLFKFE